MQRYAIFVDAGYLFAQGSKVLFGSPHPLPRRQLGLDVPRVIQTLVDFAAQILPTRELLRIYWYDGALRTRGLIGPHQELADCANVKLRLGILNRHGQQKGVDTLIVTDMIELAQNRAISDAVLLGGDEDLRVGVQIAQKHGVRVHLLGIGMERTNQSSLLRQEADVCHSWDQDILSGFLQRVVTDINDCLDECLNEVRKKLPEERFEALLSVLDGQEGIPREIDRVLLACCGQRLGRMLDDEERARLRDEARRRLLEDRRSSGD